MRHAEALAAASADEPSLYRWTTTPIGLAETQRYIEAALALRDAGTAVPFATVRAADGVVIGSTRFFEMEHWAWPKGYERHGREHADVCEIGGTWLSKPSLRTAANTEAKLLMLAHAFEVWGMLRVCFHTDARNERSAAALERIGGRFEGVLRAHRMAPDFTGRDSKRYSILAAEWPEAKQRLKARLERG